MINIYYVEYNYDGKVLSKGPKEYNLKVFLQVLLFLTRLPIVLLSTTRIIIKRKRKRIRKYNIRPGTLKIGDWAFYNSSIESVSIPNSVTTIGDGAFSGCKLEIINYSPNFKVVDNMLFDEDMKTLISCQNQNTNISIPNSVTQIGNEAFRKCPSLQSVSIPNSVTQIGGNPFVGCKLEIINHSPNFKVVDNMLFTADMKTLISCQNQNTNICYP